MQLNCDMGESYGDSRVGDDASVMPHIDQANVACGFHGGDPVTINRTLALAAAHNVRVGAHPSYPDLAGFGRRSMQLTAEELTSSLHYQIAALEGMAASHSLTLSHVKPHGALYNDAMRDPALRATLMQAIAGYHRPLPLVLQATPDAGTLRAEARAMGIEIWLEAFADRAYTADGLLQPRSQRGAVHSGAAILTQVRQLVENGTVTSNDGQRIAIEADTLCVHGDNAGAVAAIAAVRALLDKR